MNEIINPKNLPTVEFHDELRQSYMQYAQSVIVSRALPDARDGFKPVHRRILFAMQEVGFDHTKPFRKSARIVGDVMGKYHPHGDSAIYDAMVRMGQNFSMSLPLMDTQGNFGSIDGDKAAAMRYTEIRMAKVSRLLVEELGQDTVDFKDNYDGTLSEPIVLPVKFPNLLVNGTNGIAVGMATSIPPHNITEVMNGTIALVDNPDISLSEIMEHIPGPDLPTGASIMGRSGIHSLYETGHGAVVMRAKHHTEEMRGGREAIVFTEIPYQVNKKRQIEKIAELAKEKVVEGIAEIRDESDREGIRIVVEVKRDAELEVVLAQLHKHTELQTSFSGNMIALNHGRPEQMGLLDLLKCFVKFRRDVIRRRTTYLLRKAQDRAHIVAGLLVAVSNLDEVIKVIRSAKDQAEARASLMAMSLKTSVIDQILDKIIVRKDVDRSRFTEEQARAILDLRLHRLTGLELEKLDEEAKALAEQIAYFVDILSNHKSLTALLRNELVDVRDATLSERRTTLEDAEFDIDLEDLIQREDMVVAITNEGYIKRVPLSAYRTQHRGGKGKNGMNTKDNDFVTTLISTSTHTPLLFFTESGIAHKTKVYRLPEGSPSGRGRPLVNVLSLSSDDKIAAVLTLPENEEEWEDMTAVFVTENGGVRRNKLSDFSRVQKNGKIAMKLRDENGELEDRLINVLICNNDQDVMLTSKKGQVARFRADEVRVFASRASQGVRGIRLSGDDKVISGQILNHVDLKSGEAGAFLMYEAKLRRPGASHEELQKEALGESNVIEMTEARYNELKEQEQLVLSVTSTGFGKRTSSFAYRTTSRGVKGVKDKSDNPKIGELVGSFVTGSDGELMLTTKKGQMIRISVDNIRVISRNTSGVRLFKIPKDDQVVAASPLTIETELEEDETSEE